jgi:hypothetical protein
VEEREGASWSELSERETPENPRLDVHFYITPVCNGTARPSRPFGDVEQRQ